MKVFSIPGGAAGGVPASPAGLLPARSTGNILQTM